MSARYVFRHKNGNLVKPMIVVFTDGYIGQVCIHYPGCINIAIILKELLDKEVWNTFELRDVSLVDRGSGDSLTEISKERRGEIPEFADKPIAL